MSCDNDSFPTIRDCTITGNEAVNGGGIYSRTGGSPTVVQCTITQNSASLGGGLFRMEGESAVRNTIFWGNIAVTGHEIVLYSLFGLADTRLSVEHSNIRGGIADISHDGYCTLSWRDGNIDAEPKLTGDGFHLGPQSPCIDAGSDWGVYMDIDGDARPYGTGFDMGADEAASGGGCFIGSLM